MRYFAILFTIVILFTGCDKDDELLNIYGTWELTGGYLYVDNMETYEHTVYNHFDGDKTVSQLSGFNKPSFEFEVIEVNVTTWEFQLDGDIILNGDENRPLYFEEMGEYRTIIEHPTSGITMIGGSARPFRAYTYDYNNDIMEVWIQEQVGSINGYNVEWENRLLFKKIAEPN